MQCGRLRWWREVAKAGRGGRVLGVSKRGEPLQHHRAVAHGNGREPRLVGWRGGGGGGGGRGRGGDARSAAVKRGGGGALVCLWAKRRRRRCAGGIRVLLLLMVMVGEGRGRRAAALSGRRGDAAGRGRAWGWGGGKGGERGQHGSGGGGGGGRGDGRRRTPSKVEAGSSTPNPRRVVHVGKRGRRREGIGREGLPCGQERRNPTHAAATRGREWPLLPRAHSQPLAASSTRRAAEWIRSRLPGRASARARARRRAAPDGLQSGREGGCPPQHKAGCTLP